MRTLDPTRLQTVVNERLTALLKKYAERVLRRGKHQAQIARDAWLDESYVSRLLSGERSDPSREAIILLGGGPGAGGRGSRRASAGGRLQAASPSGEPQARGNRIWSGRW